MRKTMLAIFAVTAFLLHGEAFSAGPYPYTGIITDERVEEVLRANAIKAGEDIRSVLLELTPEVSIHLIQIRGEEPLHVHKAHDLIVLLRIGKGRLRLGEKVLDMKPGDMAFIPRGVPHLFKNTGEAVAVGIGIFTPSYDGKDMHKVD